MSGYDTRRATRYLPQVVLATAAVALMPVGVVWWLRSRGAITSLWAGVGLAIALSVAASWFGSAYWKRRSGPRDLLFGELLVWGWLRRVRMEHQLTKSLALLRAEPQLRSHDQSTDRRLHVLSQLAAALDAQDAYMDGHSRRVAAHTVMVARRMGLSREEVSRFRAAAAVHDIGKVRIPPEVLDKPGRLTSAEFELVKRHVDVGAEIVACLGDPELTAIVRHHHEHFDGTGYPSGLAAERIPLGARIIAVADAFDALTSVRPYRPAVSHKQALHAVVNASGTQLDRVAVRAFLRCYSGNRAIVFWSLLTVSPQRAFASLVGRAGAPANRNISLGSVATTVGAVTAAIATVTNTHIGPQPGAYGASMVHEEVPRAIVAVPVPHTTRVRRRSSKPTRRRPGARPAPGGGHATSGAGRMFAASRIVAGIPSAGSGPALETPSGGDSSGGSRGTGTGVSGGGSGGGSGGSGGGSGTGSRGGSPSGAGRGLGTGSSVGSRGGSSGGSPGGLSEGSRGGSSQGSQGGSSEGSHGNSGGGSHGDSGGASRGDTTGASHGEPHRDSRDALGVFAAVDARDHV